MWIFIWRYENHELSLIFQNICKAHNGNLIKIENAVENWFLKSIATGKIKTIIIIRY